MLFAVRRYEPGGTRLIENSPAERPEVELCARYREEFGFSPGCIKLTVAATGRPFSPFMVWPPTGHIAACRNRKSARASRPSSSRTVLASSGVLTSGKYVGATGGGVSESEVSGGGGDEAYKK